MDDRNLNVMKSLTGKAALRSSLGAQVGPGKPSLSLSALIILGSLILLFSAPSPLRSQTQGLTEDEANTIRIFREASPGVVHIEVSDFSKSLFEKEPNPTTEGAGFVIDRAGYILTAYHVIAGAGKVQITLSGGHQLTGHVVGTSPELDIALLKVEAAARELFPLRLGSSASLQIGQKVIAIGDPMGFDNTVTVGVVSSLHRSLEGTAIELRDALIQTDAASNPGRSGGPLLDSAGEVVGINNSKLGNAQRVGFAIPIDIARRIIPDLIRMGHAYLPQLGFRGTVITPVLAALFSLPRTDGYMIEEVLPGSPAAEAGFKAGQRIVIVGDTAYVLGGDIITAIDGQTVTAASELAHALLNSSPGQSVRFSVYRQGQSQEISIRLSEMKMQF